MKYIFIADEFYHLGSYGGAETCNNELIELLRGRGHEVEPVLSFFVTPNFISENKAIYIIGNFFALPEDSREALKSRRYILYEHDHKYLRSRDPSVYEGYLAPKDHVINKDFYKNASLVVVQSSVHKKVIESNLKLDNIIVGINLWSKEHLADLENNQDVEKVWDAVVMDHIYQQKNPEGAKKLCFDLKYNYIVVSHGTDHATFCSILASAKNLVFLPTVLETLSRVCVEAHCVNTELLVNNNISYLSEHWSKLRGLELIDYIKSSTEDTVKIFERYEPI